MLIATVTSIESKLLKIMKLSNWNNKTKNLKLKTSILKCVCKANNLSWVPMKPRSTNWWIWKWPMKSKRANYWNSRRSMIYNNRNLIKWLRSYRNCKKVPLNNNMVQTSSLWNQEVETWRVWVAVCLQKEPMNKHNYRGRSGIWNKRKRTWCGRYSMSRWIE